MTYWRLFLALLIILAACDEQPTSNHRAVVAKRIVSLAPNLTELVHTVGAGEQLVGVSAWSDYPRSVLDLPVVGDAFSVDHEQLSLLRPDLLLVWQSGTPQRTVDELRAAGFNVVAVRTRGLDDIGRALVTIGELSGHREQAEQAAQRFDAELLALRHSVDADVAIRVFYQVSARPLYTVNREHYISELIALCGGRNIFEDLSELAPTVDVEAVVARDPEVMLASTDAGDDAFEVWQRWPEVAANRANNLFLLPGDEIGRPTTRLLIAANSMCIALEKARQNSVQTERED